MQNDDIKVWFVFNFQIIFFAPGVLNLKKPAPGPVFKCAKNIYIIGVPFLNRGIGWLVMISACVAVIAEPMAMFAMILAVLFFAIGLL